MEPHRTGKPRIYLRSRKEVQRRAKDIEAAIRKAFEGAEFTTGGGVDGVVHHSISLDSSDKGHLIAMDHDRVVGALFHVPIKRHPGEEFTGVGWLFTSPSLPKDVRRELGNRLVRRFHDDARRLGYKRIVTSIGTVDGVAFLGKHHGHYQSPDPNLTGYWVKDL